jgi:hypothetical protein
MVCAEFERIEQAERRAAAVTLKDLVDRAGNQSLKHEQLTRGVVEAMTEG